MNSNPKSFDPKVLKKVELHVHLDTCMSYYCARQLRPELRLAYFNREFVAPKKCHDLSDFLSKLEPILGLMQTEAAITAAVDDLFDQFSADNVIYAEFRVAPLLHSRLGLESALVVQTVLDAMQRASEFYGLDAGLILCTLRHFSEAESLQTAEPVTRFMDKGVVALDLAADEARFPLDNHLAAFQLVRDSGGHVIAHAGEALGAGSISETLDKLHVSRIGHGVRSIEDSVVIEKLIEQAVLLEVCLSCNIVCDVFDTIQDHPVNQLKQAGVKLNINTDARTTANTSLNNEYQLLHNVFGWEHDDFVKTNLDAIDASFANAETKAKIKAMILESSS